MISIEAGLIIFSISGKTKGSVGYMFRFTAIRPEFEEAWKILAVKIVKHCKEIVWTEKNIITSFEKWDIIEPQIKKLEAELFDTQVQYELERI